ncbi:hypothetical protein [Paenibacillus sp. SN-8-1]|uniref:hypothetical protein n=1 Tax=Paenibacillus sp. SN-8-1 TaxID=3435409 RepID=UPI003D9A6F02
MELVYKNNIVLSDEMLKSKGWAYLFDISHIKESPNDEFVNEHVQKIYLSALDAISKQRSKKLQKGPFVIWHCMKRLVDDQNRPTQGYVLFITPFYHEIVGRDVDPVVETMWTHKGYIRASSSIPLIEGAMPLCLFEEGQAIAIDIDDVLLSRLSDFFEEQQYMLSLSNPHIAIRLNPYEG